MNRKRKKYKLQNELKLQTGATILFCLYLKTCTNLLKNPAGNQQMCYSGESDCCCFTQLKSICSRCEEETDQTLAGRGDYWWFIETTVCCGEQSSVVVGQRASQISDRKQTVWRKKSVNCKQTNSHRERKDKNSLLFFTFLRNNLKFSFFVCKSQITEVRQENLLTVKKMIKLNEQ